MIHKLVSSSLITFCMLSSSFSFSSDFSHTDGIDLEEVRPLLDGWSSDEADVEETESKEAETAIAKLQLAGRYYYGTDGVEVDLKKAFNLYQEAADLGSVRAFCEVGYCYSFGKGVKQNSKKAVYWYSKAAEKGDQVAQCNLGICLESGKGVEKDLKAAFELFTKAAIQGDRAAQCKLGYCFEHGLGAKKNNRTAIKWYEKASADGFHFATMRLGIMWASGAGHLFSNKTKAYNLLLIAANAGVAEAKDLLKDIESELFSH